MGNLGSLVNMFKRINVQARVESDPDIIRGANKLVLPGVGAFDTAMNHINTVDGLQEVLDYKATEECVPTLGICLGMQLLTNCSDEGQLSGLGWIQGTCKRFPKESDLKVPHMGWNIAKPTNRSKLTFDLSDELRYYFVHSYYVTVDNPSHSIMQTDYGVNFDSAIARDNIYGVQFHPEKSHRYGMQILRNFAQI